MNIPPDYSLELIKDMINSLTDCLGNKENVFNLTNIFTFMFSKKAFYLLTNLRKTRLFKFFTFPVACKCQSAEAARFIYLNTSFLFKKIRLLPVISQLLC